MAPRSRSPRRPRERELTASAARGVGDLRNAQCPEAPERPVVACAISRGAVSEAAPALKQLAATASPHPFARSAAGAWREAQVEADVPCSSGTSSAWPSPRRVVASVRRAAESLKAGPLMGHRVRGGADQLAVAAPRPRALRGAADDAGTICSRVPSARRRGRHTRPRCNAFADELRG